MGNGEIGVPCGLKLTIKSVKNLWEF